MSPAIAVRVSAVLLGTEMCRGKGRLGRCSATKASCDGGSRPPRR